MCCIIKSVLVLAMCLAGQQRGVNCGEEEVGTLLIAGGRETPPVSAPWNAGLFRAAGPENPGTFDFKCGGTLITKKLVITAAHCLYQVQHVTHKIALGKYFREWNHSENSLQRMDIKRSVIHPRYRASERNYEHDICVVELATSAELTNSVQLAEAVWASYTLKLKILTNYNLGLVAGWSNLQSGQLSVLNARRSNVLPCVDAQSCVDSGPEHTRLMTEEAFCPGFITQNKSVCKGSSGSGLIFRDPGNKHPYLAGVTSIAYRTEPSGNIWQHYAGFTDVTEHHNQQWLKTFLNTGVRNNATVPPGYQMLAELDNAYKYHTQRATWLDAKKVCEDEGAHLVIINSEAESRAVAADADFYSWVGVRESSTENSRYFTVLGGRLQDTGFNRWSDYKYFDNSSALGDVVWINSYDGGLGDLRAADNDKLAFTCELQHTTLQIRT